MKSLPSVSLIITTYNWPQALKVTLLSVMKQTVMPDQIIIADDGSGEDTAMLIANMMKKFKGRLQHIWHEDIGFTRTIILNKAIKTVNTEYIIQIDGDIILHPRFVEDHLKFARPNSFVSGSRAMINSKISKSVLKHQITKLTFLSFGINHRFNGFRFPPLIWLLGKPKMTISNLRGCNMAYWKKDFQRVNGYNEEIVGWGREDSELAARFINNGIAKRKLKCGAIQFHVHHLEASRQELSNNDAILKNTIDNKLKFCNKGYYDLCDAIQKESYKDTFKGKISATIITFNEEKNIEKCLRSIAGVVDEIVVVDSYSTDNTEKICQKYNVIFIKNKFEGHIQQKQFAISKTKYRFVLSLDADEYLSEKLRKSIVAIKDNLVFDAYTMNRLNFYRGKTINYAGWYPDTRIRLFDKVKAHWGGENPHDIVVVDNKKYTSHLIGDLHHNTLNSLAEHKHQTEKYAVIAAQYKYEHGMHRQTVFFKMLMNPISKFFTMYFLKLGFLDGKFGLRICFEEFKCTYRKYKKLYRLYKNETLIAEKQA